MRIVVLYSATSSLEETEIAFRLPWDIFSFSVAL